MKDSQFELLDSIVAQTVTPDEAIFVDGGSSDQTQDIISEYAEENEWLAKTGLLMKVLISLKEEIQQ